MKQFFLVSILAFLFANSANSQTFSPSWKWIKTDTSVGSNANQALIKEVVATSNNKIISAYLKKGKIGSTGYMLGDYQINEYDTAGNLIASTTITGKIAIKDIQADAMGNWYVSAILYDTVTFASGKQYTTNTWGGESKYCMFKLDGTTLKLDWFQKLTATSLTRADCYTVTSDKIYLVTDSAHITTVSRLNPNTGYRSAVLFSQTGASVISSVQVDKNSNIYMAGYCTNDAAFNGINFNGVQSTPTLTSDYLTYIVKYNAVGQHLWHIWMPDNQQTPRQLNLVADNFIYYSGPLHDSMSLCSSFLQHPGQNSDFMLARLDSAGHTVWARQAVPSQGDVYLEASCHAAVNADSSITLIPTFSGTVNWGNGVTSTSTTSSYRNAACVHIAATGATKWVREMSAYEVYPQQIVASDYDVYVTGIGRDSNAISFGGTLIPAKMLYTPFVARLNTLEKKIVVVETGIGNTPAPLAVTVLPNPATSTISISGLDDVHTALVMDVVDMSGKIVYQSTIPEGTREQKIDVTDYARGMYVLQVRGGGMQYTGKIVLR